MGQILYLDFDLAIESFGDGYRARVLDSPAGQATNTFRFPLDDWELETFLVWLAGAPHRTRRVESKEMRAAKQLGARLFNAAFAGDVRTCWQRSLDESQRRDAGLRIRLRLSGAPELAELPWEFLYDPTANQFLALSMKTPLVRYFDLQHSTRPVAVKPPLRVLVMVSNPADWDTLDVDQERAKVKRALAGLIQRGLVIVDFLPDATLDGLQHRLRQGAYHLFHFIGHGGFDQDRRDGVLIFRDENGRGHRITSQRLSAILTDHSALRLVILNACEGARGAREDPFTGVAQTLVQRGIPAVIAMQYEVSDQVAIAFAQEFYAALVDDYPVDAAVSEARKTVYGQGSDVAWGIPVIYMRAPDGRLFDFDARTQKKSPRRVARATQFAIGALGVCVLLVLCALLINITRVNEFWRALGSPENAWLAALAPTPTRTQTATPTFTPTSIPTLTPTLTVTHTLTHTPTRVPPTATTRATNTASPTATRTHTPSPTHTASPSPTHTASPSPTPSSTPTATHRPNTRTLTPTPSPTLPPGVYLTAFRIEPETPFRNEPIYFGATFLNAAEALRAYRVRFQIYDAQTNKRFTDTALQTLHLAQGATDLTPPHSWTYNAPLTGCVAFYAQLVYQTDSARIPFTDPQGQVMTRAFQICSPE